MRYYVPEKFKKKKIKVFLTNQAFVIWFKIVRFKIAGFE